MQRNGVEAQIADRSVCPPFEAHALPPNHGWTVVIWPSYFQDIAAARALSESLSTAVVTSHEHDNDYWTLVVFDDGRLVVRFASQPSYFSQSLVKSDTSRGSGLDRRSP